MTGRYRSAGVSKLPHQETPPKVRVSAPSPPKSPWRSYPNDPEDTPSRTTSHAPQPQQPDDVDEKLADLCRAAYGDRARTKFAHLIKERIAQNNTENAPTIKRLRLFQAEEVSLFPESDDRMQLARRNGCFLVLMPDKETFKAITAAEEASGAYDERAIPVCPGDEVVNNGAFGLRSATHHGVYIGRPEAAKESTGTVVEVDSLLNGPPLVMAEKMLKMVINGGTPGIIVTRTMDEFTWNDDFGNERRPVHVRLSNALPVATVIERAINALQCGYWEYHAIDSSCETFARFICTGNWQSDQCDVFRTYSGQLVRAAMFLITEYERTHKDDPDRSKVMKLLYEIKRVHEIYNDPRTLLFDPHTLRMIETFLSTLAENE